MNKKLKLAIAALLGFSTACSTVKNTQTKEVESNDDSKKTPPSLTIQKPPKIVVMYGVRNPEFSNLEQRVQKMKKEQTPQNEQKVDEKTSQQNAEKSDK